MNKKLEKKLDQLFNEQLFEMIKYCGSGDPKYIQANIKADAFLEVIGLNEEGCFDQEKKTMSSMMECDCCGNSENLNNIFLNIRHNKMYCKRCVSKECADYE